MKVCKSFTGICLWILISVCVASCGPAESDHDVPDQKSPESFVKSDINNLWKEAYIKYREYPSDLGSAERVREIAQMMPTNDDAQMALAVVERNLGNWEEAEAGFNRIVERNPLYAGALWNLGRLAIRRGETDLAADYFAKSIKASPHAWQPVYAMAQLRQQEGDPVAAKAMFAQAKMLGAGKTDRFGGMDAMKPSPEMAKELLEWD